MLSDGDLTYTWDRAERLRTVTDGGVTTQYAYNGMGQRISQTVDSIVTEYLLDVQPGLTKFIRQTTGANSTAFVHGPAGLTRQQQPDGAWLTPLSDGLGSIRTLVDDTTLLPVMSQHYTPYGQPLDTQGSGTPYGFTGELTDADGLLYLRARYYNPELGVFPSLDPVQNGNRYAYVNGNPVGFIDPTGMFGEIPPTCTTQHPQQYIFDDRCWCYRGTNLWRTCYEDALQFDEYGRNDVVTRFPEGSLWGPSDFCDLSNCGQFILRAIPTQPPPGVNPTSDFISCPDSTLGVACLPGIDACARGELPLYEEPQPSALTCQLSVYYVGENQGNGDIILGIDFLGFEDIGCNYFTNDQTTGVGVSLAIPQLSWIFDSGPLDLPGNHNGISCSCGGSGLLTFDPENIECSCETFVLYGGTPSIDFYFQLAIPRQGITDVLVPRPDPHNPLDWEIGGPFQPFLCLLFNNQCP